MLRNAMAFAASALILAACGGGGGAESGAPVVTLASGQVDSSYGAGGRVVFGPDKVVDDVAVDSSGNAYFTGSTLAKADARGILVAGYGGSYGGSFPVLDESGNLYAISNVAVLKADGAGRPAVFAGPVFPANSGIENSLTALARDPSGNVFAVGYSFCADRFGPDCETVVAAKFDRNGNAVQAFAGGAPKYFSEFHPRNLGFGVKGTAATPVPAVADGSGNLYISGQLNDGYSYIAKVRPDASVDAGFGMGGLWRPPACFTVLSVSTDASGALLVAGQCAGRAAVMKIDGQGSVVSGFGIAGMAMDVFGAPDSSAWRVLAAGDALYVAGAVAGTCRDAAVSKLDPQGRAVFSFGTHGVTTLDSGWDYAPNRLALDAAGRLYVGGNFQEGCPTQPAIPSYALFRLGG